MCHLHAPIFWLYLRGHIRTFIEHTNNLQSFLQNSSRCWFVVIFTPDELDKHDFGIDANVVHPWSPSSTNILNEFKKRNESVPSFIEKATRQLGDTNIAFATVSQIDTRPDSHHYTNVAFVCLVALGIEVAKFHSIPRHANDIVGVSRPDLLYTHAINVDSLVSVANTIPFVLMPHHRDNTIGGNDPSEMFVVAVRRFWETICPMSNKTKPNRWHGCIGISGCGYYAPVFVYAAARFGFMPFFYFTRIQFQLHRLTGQRVTFMAGEPVLIKSTNDSVVGRVDISIGAMCIVGRQDACFLPLNRNPPPLSSCLRPTRWQAINPIINNISSGLWVCQNVSTVDKCV